MGSSPAFLSCSASVVRTIIFGIFLSIFTEEEYVVQRLVYVNSWKFNPINLCISMFPTHKESAGRFASSFT